MLLKLNRFMTTEEVRREYRVPPSLAPTLLPALPVAATTDGANIHLESEVDEFVSKFVHQNRDPAARSDPPAPARGGQQVETLEIALYAEELKQQGKVWKEIFKACKVRWPNDHRVRNSEQVRATHRRYKKSVDA